MIPESKPGDYDEVTRLRLQLAQAELQRDAYQAALRKEVLDIIREALSENARLKAECQARQAENSVLAVECDSLKAEVDRLTSDIQMEKENEDRLVREWQKANNEVYGLQRQVAALIDDQTRLKAEVERLNTGIQPEGSNDAVGRAVNVLLEKQKEIANLKAEVERLTKAEDNMIEVTYIKGVAGVDGKGGQP